MLFHDRSMRRFILITLLGVFALGPAPAAPAALWTETRVGGEQPNGPPLGISFSVAPDGLALFQWNAATGLQSGVPLAINASVVREGVPGPLTPVATVPSWPATAGLTAAGPGQMAVLAQSQASPRITIARGPVGGTLGAVKTIENDPETHLSGPVGSSPRGDLAFTSSDGTRGRLDVVVVCPGDRVRLVCVLPR